MQAKKALCGYSREYIPVSFSAYVHTYLVSYLASILSSPTLCATAWLACIVMPRLDIDTIRRVVFLKSATGDSVLQIMKCQTSINNSELILANTDIFLPSNQLTEQTQRG